MISLVSRMTDDELASLVNVLNTKYRDVLDRLGYEDSGRSMTDPDREKLKDDLVDTLRMDDDCELPEAEFHIASADLNEVSRDDATKHIERLSEGTSNDLDDPLVMAEAHDVDVIEVLSAVIDSEDRGLLDRLASWDRWEEVRDLIEGHRAMSNDASGKQTPTSQPKETR